MRVFKCSHKILLHSGSSHVCLLGQLPKCSDLFMMIWTMCNLIVATCVLYGLPLNQSLCHALRTRFAYLHAKLRFLTFPAGPLLLLDLQFTSCLFFEKLRRLSFIEHRMMMLECMHVCGFCHMFFLVRCRENFLKILEPWSKFMIATMKMHNEDPIESFFGKRLRSRSTESWQLLFMQ